MSYVYAVSQINPSGKIEFNKFGYTTNPLQIRIWELNTGNPNKIIYRGHKIGTLNEEKIIHEMFNKYKTKTRYGGGEEWYYPCQEIENYIVDNLPFENNWNVFSRKDKIIYKHIIEKMKNTTKYNSKLLDIPYAQDMLLIFDLFYEKHSDVNLAKFQKTMIKHFNLSKEHLKLGRYNGKKLKKSLFETQSELAYKHLIKS